MRTVHPPSFLTRLNEDGFALVKTLASPAEVLELSQSVDRALDGASAIKRAGSGYALRNLSTAVPEIKSFSASPGVTQLLEKVFSRPAFLVRGILFDKNATANWRVGWHQDTAIAVRERIDTPGFNGWSTKDGVPHVHPPAAVLEGLLTIRLHLDAADEDNGPLEVIPGSHVSGRLDLDRTRDWLRNRAPVVCAAEAGDALIMRPLLLHASRQARKAGRRRVVHLEFAAHPLPAGLNWYRM